MNCRANHILVVVSWRHFFLNFFLSFPRTYQVDEVPALSDDCRYLVLLAKVQNKVDKNEEALLSLQRVCGCCHLSTYCVMQFWLVWWGLHKHITSPLRTGPGCAGQGAEAGAVGAAWRRPHAETACRRDLRWDRETLHKSEGLWEGSQILQRSSCVLWDGSQGQCSRMKNILCVDCSCG